MEDDTIVSLFLERSENAVRETQKQYGQLIRTAAMRILRCEADAEECENDVYMAIWNRIPPERPNCLKAFLLKITRNQALKRYEYLTAEKRSPSAAVSLDELGECADCGGEEIRFGDWELAELINKFLGSLNDEARKVFLLRYWGFLSVKEITDRCGISKSKAESMLFRTRNKLKKFLDENNGRSDPK